MNIRVTYHAVSRARLRHPDRFPGRQTAEEIEEEVRAAIRNGRTARELEGYNLDLGNWRGAKQYFAWTPGRERVYIVKPTATRKIVITVLPKPEADVEAA